MSIFLQNNQQNVNIQKLFLRINKIKLKQKLRDE